jgi:tetratricopeptide (TPR) repeat protein
MPESIAMAEEFSYAIGFDDVDSSILPERARSPGTEPFLVAVTKLLEDQYREFGGRVQIAVDEGNRRIDVRWSADPAGPNPGDVVLDRLQRGEHEHAVSLLRVLLRHEPANPLLHYNLGMALSDMGQVQEAQEHLREALKGDPTNINALVAFGVAQARASDREENFTSFWIA